MASKIIYKHRRGLAEDWKVWLQTGDNKLENGEIAIIDSDPGDNPNHLRLLVGDGKEHPYEEMPKFAYAQEEGNSVVSPGYDYAEYFKWSDDVPAEYRTAGRFVTIAENTRTIRPAQPDDKVLGITSNTASIIGNWDEGNRSAEDGWIVVGLLGIVQALHDHTCTENGYAMIGADGIATLANDAFGYKIVNVNDEAGTIEVVLGNDSDMISRIKTEIDILRDNMSNMISVHDELYNTIVPDNGQTYVVRYDNMPMVDADGNIIVSDEVIYVTKIGDGETSLAQLPPVSSLVAGSGTGSSIQFIEEEAYGIETENGVRYPRPIATGYAAAALGRYTEAHGLYSMAVNYDSVAEGDKSFACNSTTTASGISSFASGHNTTASGTTSFASGHYTVASGESAHSEGHTTKASGNYSHAEGHNTEASGEDSHAEGYKAKAIGIYSHSEGYITSAEGDAAHAEGYGTKAIGLYSHSEGYNTKATGNYSHVEGRDNVAEGLYSHSEGYNAKAIGNYSHAEGRNVKAEGEAVHAEGYGTTASGKYSHAEGYETVASGARSHAAGGSTIAKGDYSHAEGYITQANGGFSHSKGRETIANGIYSYASGYLTNANVEGSFAHGKGLEATKAWQTVFGQYNSPSETGVFVIGAGTSKDNKKNVFEVDKSGYIKINQTSDGEAAGTEPTIYLGKTAITESQLSDLMKSSSGNSITEEQLAAKADKIHDHNDIYYTEDEINAKLKIINETIEGLVVDPGGEIPIGIYETKTDAEAKLDAAKAYTDTAVGGKADAKHNHDDLYYTASEMDSRLSTINNSITSIQNGKITVLKASQDSAGNLITTTYETKDDALMKFSEAKEYVFECIDSLQADIASGAVTVAYAGKSECDWEGNVISSTYETKTDATSKLTEAKEYALDCVDNLQVDITSGNITAAYAYQSECDGQGLNIAETYAKKVDVTPQKIGAATSATYTTTIGTSWTASGDYYYQDVTVNGILDTDNPIVDILTGDDNAANIEHSKNICKVFRITTSENSIRVWATKEIDAAIPIQMKVVR